jgi:hypothetical protein
MSSPTFPLQLGTHRNLPNPQVDGSGQTPRGGRYGEMYVDGIVPTKHLLADEGVYYTAAMAPSATPLAYGLRATFLDTAAFIVIGNGNNPGTNRIYLDYMKMSFSVAPASATAGWVAAKLDNISRAPTANSVLQSPANCNMDLNTPSQANIWFPTGGTLTVPASSGQARTIFGNLALRNVLPTVGDEYTLQVGGVDRGETEFSAVATATIVKRTLYCPPMVIGGGQYLVFYLWFPSNASTAASFNNLEVGYWER